MSFLKFSPFTYRLPRCYRSMCFRKTQSIKRCMRLQSFKIQYQCIVVPIFQVRLPKCSHLFEALYSSKADKGKPLNLESPVDYEKISEETLQSLYDRFEEILEDSHYEDYDVNYSNGVLTVTLEPNCVYVINKQTPNRQIWLSSPKSGPKRYDYVNGTWIYKYDGVSLHKLLSSELTKLLQKEADFLVCTYSS